jgi:2-haloacid dehalogenase
VVSDGGAVSGIDAVLFDLGNVLVGWDPLRPFVGRRSRAEVERFFSEIDFMAFNHEQDAGRSWADARAALATTHPEHVPMLDIYVEHYPESVYGEIPGGGELVRVLAAAGVRSYGLTNWPAETFHVALEHTTVVARLDGVLVSGQEGMAKPDPRIFRLVVERFGLDVSRTLFTDDSERNVAAAAAAGFRTHHFDGYPALRGALRTLGVAVPST